jgi:hypothetical protein
MSTSIYNDCGCGNKPQQPGIKPPNLKCPPDISSMLFRFIERKKIGIVQGQTELASLDMSSFFMPLNTYTLQRITLCPGDIKKVDPAGISTTGKRPQINLFDLTDITAIFTEDSYGILTVFENSETLVTLTDIDAPDFETFILNLRVAIANNPIATTLFRVGKYDTANNTFELVALKSGKYLEYNLTLDDGIAAVEEDSLITQTAERYPNGGVLKVLFAAIEFLPEAKSNRQFLEYAYNNDYIENGNSAHWRKTSKLLVLTGADDIEDTDENLIETVWFKNTTETKINVYLLLGI